MMARWYVCCSGAVANEIAKSIMAIKHTDNVVVGSNPQLLRQQLATSSFGVNNVVVGPMQADINPINIAACLVKDGWARDVILVVDSPSGSLKSRAIQAGIHSVLSTEEVLGLTCVAENKKSRENDTSKKPSIIKSNLATHVSSSDCTSSLNVENIKEKLLEKTDSKPCNDFENRFSNLDEPDGIEVVRKVARNKNSGSILAISSGRGGVGKSCLVATMAAIGHKWGMKVCVVDLDFACGNLYSYFGLAHIPDIAAVASAEILDSKSLVGATFKIDGCQDFRILGPCEMCEASEIVDRSIVNILHVLANSFDLVLIDTSHTPTSSSARAFQVADRVLFVADERAAATSSLLRAAGFAERIGVAQTRIIRVINRVDAKGKDQVFLDKVVNSYSSALTFCVDDGGVDVGQIMSLGHASSIADLNNCFVKDTAHMLAKILESQGRLPESEYAKSALLKTQKKKSISNLFARG